MKVLKVKISEEAIVPKYNHSTDAALDLFASGEFTEISSEGKKELKTETFILEAGKRVLVKTGVKIELPSDCWGNIRSRSGLALNEGIITLGGVIDPDYRGEIGVILLNTSDVSFEIKKHGKIAQMIIQPFEHAEIVQTEDLSETERAHKGFGSSGKN
jgi:dUTP pyrophosphatase